MKKSLLITSLALILGMTSKANCPTSVAIVGDSIVFTYSGGVPSWTVLKKIRYYTSVGSGTSYTTSVGGTNATSTTITVPKPSAVNTSTSITEILLRVPSSGAGYCWNHACTFNFVLPVELTSFEAVRTEDNVRLEWTTASELNNDYFEVLKSYDGEIFSVIGYVDGHGTSSEVIDYSYTDSEPKQAYYRLRQLDYDGQFEYSDVVAAKGNGREVISVRYYTFAGVETQENKGGLVVTKYTDGSYTKTMVSK
mgnify:FL=1